MCQIDIINIFLFFKYDDIKLKYNYSMYISNVENPTSEEGRFACRIFDIRRRPISDRKSNRIFLHTSNNDTIRKKLTELTKFMLVKS